MASEEYVSHFDILEDPDSALAEIYIRGRHSDGTLLAYDEKREMGDRLYPEIRSSTWFQKYGDIILEEAQRKGQI
jgi:hypothetical protein